MLGNIRLNILLTGSYIHLAYLILGKFVAAIFEIITYIHLKSIIEHCYTLTIKAPGLVVSDKKISFYVFPTVSIRGLM